MARSVNPGHDREARRVLESFVVLLRKLKKLLTETFPPPATIRLEEHDGIVGVITSAEFARMETIDRQELIRHTYLQITAQPTRKTSVC